MYVYILSCLKSSLGTFLNWMEVVNFMQPHDITSVVQILDFDLGFYFLGFLFLCWDLIHSILYQGVPDV